MAARDRLDVLRPRVLATRNPSAIAWVHYVTGEATAEVDPHGALASYRAAIEDAAKVGKRLFLGLARSSACCCRGWGRTGRPHSWPASRRPVETAPTCSWVTTTGSGRA